MSDGNRFNDITGPLGDDECQTVSLRWRGQHTPITETTQPGYDTTVNCRATFGSDVDGDINVIAGSRRCRDLHVHEHVQQHHGLQGSRAR